MALWRATTCCGRWRLMLTSVSQESGGEEAFVGQTGQAEFVIITDASHARDIRDRLATRIHQSLRFLLPV